MPATEYLNPASLICLDNWLQDSKTAQQQRRIEKLQRALLEIGKQNQVVMVGKEKTSKNDACWRKLYDLIWQISIILAHGGIAAVKSHIFITLGRS